MSLCPKMFIKLLVKMEVTAEGQIVPSVLAEPGRTWGGAVWLLAKTPKQILLWSFERKQKKMIIMTVLQLHASSAEFVRTQRFCNPGQTCTCIHNHTQSHTDVYIVQRVQISLRHRSRAQILSTVCSKGENCKP